MVAYEIGVDGLVMALSDAKPADGYRVIGNLVRLEQFSEILKHPLVGWSGILALGKRDVVLPQNLKDVSWPPEVLFPAPDLHKSLRPRPVMGRSKRQRRVEVTLRGLG
jgi:hypothetical protein